ncbi:MAG TPA: PPC domain-containing protein, partial [Pyrinomonadaceae bacterium]|nr:PPC domain-containing protein [Pyrinomonadaceae bacterium]
VSPAQQAGGGRIREQDVFTSTNVLTPGETDEWPLAARDNETFIVTVSSESFDPAAELVSPQGQVLAQNDDVRPGEQDSLLLARVTAAGAYKVRVKASKPAAGGQYELTVRRFVATDMAVGARTVGTLGRTLVQWHRFPAQAGQTLVVTARAASFQPGLEVYAPNGEELDVQSAGERTGGARAVFRVAQGGTYHVRVASARGDAQPRSSYALTAAVARVFPAVVGQTLNEARTIDAGGLDLWTFKGKAGDLVRARASAAGGAMSAQLSFVPPVDPKTGEPRPHEGSVPPFVVLPSDPKAGGEVVALLNTEGDYQVAVSQPLGLGVGYTFDMTRPLRDFVGRADGAGALALGGSDYWVLEAKAGEILRFKAAAETFDTALQLFNPRGERVGADDDGGENRNSLLTALLVEPGRYLLRVHAHGDGGAGPYLLGRVADAVRQLPPAGRADGSVGTGGSEIWSFQGRAGQTVILSVRSPDFDTRVNLYGPDAAELAADDNGGEGTDSLLSVRLPLGGTYTVWVSAQSGGGRYSLRLIDAQ